MLYGGKFKLTTGATRPPKTITPDMNEKAVKYSCFKVFGVWLKNKYRIAMRQ